MPVAPRARSLADTIAAAGRAPRRCSLVFHTDDCFALYETLKSRGVTDFTQEPTEHGYGVDMGVRDPFANGIRFLQPRARGRKPSSSEATAASR